MSPAVSPGGAERCAHRSGLRPRAPRSAFRTQRSFYGPAALLVPGRALYVFSYKRFQGEGDYLIACGVIYGRGGRGRSRPMWALLEGRPRFRGVSAWPKAAGPQWGASRGTAPRGLPPGGSGGSSGCKTRCLLILLLLLLFVLPPRGIRTPRSSTAPPSAPSRITSAR